MMRFRKILWVSCVLLCPTLVAAQQPEDEPHYSDKNGEELFGADYMPADPTDVGATLLVGHPAAGYQSDSAELSQASLVSPMLMAEGTHTLRVPLRRSVQKKWKLPRFDRLRKAKSRRPLAAPVFAPEIAAHTLTATMRAHFVYVGQGAGAILEFPCGVAVIDTGGEFGPGVAQGGKLFADYLDAFFAARPQLNRTIDVLFTSHPHTDHMKGLSLLIPNGQPAYRIRNIVDNGQTGSDGALGKQTDARNAARSAGAGYSAVRLQDQFSATGSTNAVIDPFKCPTVDPIITAFWGSRNEAVTPSAQPFAHKYNNPNEHSVVLRVDFGKASFLFTGDLMKDGLKDMLSEYASNPKVFDVDVYHVGHHGADNGTSEALLRRLTPKIAIISMGDNSQQKPSTAWDHGHPRLTTLASLQKANVGVSTTRPPKVFWGASAEETPFTPVTINKAIYGTGWEGSIILEAKSDGTYKIVP
jgi:beta-lactamase superfamily II metal-dependent hydrolase